MRYSYLLWVAAPAAALLESVGETVKDNAV